MRLKSRSVRKGARSDGEDRRKAILRAAVTVFSRRGFERGTTREIAKAAGCNIAAIRYYFGDKAGLIASVMESSMEALMEGGGHPVLAPPGPRVEPREELRTWILWVLRTGRRKRRSSASPGAGADLLMHALTLRGETARHLAARLGAPVRGNILKLVDQLCGGTIAPDVREHACAFIFNLCSRFAEGGPILENMGIAVPEDDAEIEVLADRLTNFVIGGLHTMTSFAADKPANGVRS